MDKKYIGIYYMCVDGKEKEKRRKEGRKKERKRKGGRKKERKKKNERQERLNELPRSHSI